MKNTKHNEEAIIYALKRVEAGSKGLEVCREDVKMASHSAALHSRWPVLYLMLTSARNLE